MATQAKDQMCDTLIRKMTAGDSLNAAEKTHLAGCAECMSQVVKTLDEAALSEAHGLGGATSGTNGDLGHARPEAKKALAHGREVFEREFGISLGDTTA